MKHPSLQAILFMRELKYGTDTKPPLSIPMLMALEVEVEQMMAERGKKYTTRKLLQEALDKITTGYSGV